MGDMTEVKKDTGELLQEWASTHFPKINKPQSQEFIALANFLGALTVSPKDMNEDWLARVLPDMANKGKLLMTHPGVSLELLIRSAKYAIELSCGEIGAEQEAQIVKKLKSELSR